LFYFLT